MSTISEKMWRPVGVVKKVRGRPLLMRMTFTVPVPLEIFYEWFTDFSNYAHIFDHIISITPLDANDPFEVGKLYSELVHNYKGGEEEFLVTVQGIKPYRSIMVKVSNRRETAYYKFYFVGLKKSGKTMFTICHYVDNIGWLKVKSKQIGLRLLFFNRKRKAANRLRKIFRG